jgi:YVTN family beta-propeller protein
VGGVDELGQPAGVRSGWWAKRGLIIIVVGVVTLAAVVAWIVLRAPDSQKAPSVDVERHLIGSVDVGRHPGVVAVGAGGVWVTNTDDGTVSRVDPARNRVAATIRVEAHPWGVAVGAGGVWVTNFNDDTVSRID